MGEHKICHPWSPHKQLLWLRYPVKHGLNRAWGNGLRRRHSLEPGGPGGSDTIRSSLKHDRWRLDSCRLTQQQLLLLLPRRGRCACGKREVASSHFRDGCQSAGAFRGTVEAEPCHAAQAESWSLSRHGQHDDGKTASQARGSDETKNTQHARGDWANLGEAGTRTSAAPGLLGGSNGLEGHAQRCTEMRSVARFPLVSESTQGRPTASASSDACWLTSMYISCRDGSRAHPGATAH